MADARVPVAQASAGATATAEGGRFILGERARLSNVLRGDPDRVTIGHCGPIVAPAGTRRIPHIILVAGEAIIGSQTSFRNVDITDTSQRVDGGIAGARIIVGPDHRKG